MKKKIMMFLLMSNVAWSAGGYEKPSLWSPKAVGVGGAYSSSVNGADSIQYNPAALDRNEVGVNLAVLGGYLKAPVEGATEKTNDDVVYSGGLVSSYKYSDKIGFGFGAYGLAGLDTRYENINYGRENSNWSNYTKDYYGNLQAVEYALGLSYKLTPKLSLGAALRAQSFKANFGQTAIYRDNSGVANDLISAEFKDLKGNSLGSYQLGLQFLDDSWGLGLTYRSSVTAKVKGKSSGERIDATGSVTPLGNGKSTITAFIPEQVNADLHFDVIKDRVRLLTGYSWTKYSKNQQLTVSGNMAQKIDQHWKDMNDYKFGVSFLGQTTVSLGYTYTTPVTNKNYASANAAPPGPYHHYGASVSRTLNSKVSLDGAFEYYESKGSGKTAQSASPFNAGDTTGGQKGNYSSGVWATYLGMRYAF